MQAGLVAKLGRAAAILGLVSLTSTTVLSFLGQRWWLFDLLSHFRVLALGLAAMILLGTLALRRWGLAGWSLGVIAIHLALLLPLYRGSVELPNDGPRLRVVSFNAHIGNPRAAEAARYIAGLEPDVVALFEVSQTQVDAFAAALPGFHLVSEPRPDAFGIAVFSKAPLAEAKVHRAMHGRIPWVTFSIEMGETQVAIAAVHPPPPVNAARSRTRDAILQSVGDWVNDRTGDAIVLGDFNATVWSAPLRTLRERTGLVSTQRFGVQPTWPAALGPLGIAIDDVLVSGRIATVDRFVGPAFDSDHRMVMVDLAIVGLPARGGDA